MTHPLTDEICIDLGCGPERNDWYVTDMRAAYDLALEHVDELWIEAQQEDDPVDVVSHFESRLRLLFINKFLRSQQQEDDQ